MAGEPMSKVAPHPAETPPDARNQLDALYRSHSGALLRFLARQRVSRDEAQDLVHEAYVRVQQSGDVGGIRHPKAFLFRVVSNLLFNSLKRRRLLGITPLPAECPELVDEGTAPQRALDAERELAIVRAAFTELPAKCRLAFVMNRFEDMSYPQIARELNVSVSMVEKHVSQALAHLRSRVLREPDARPVEGSGPRKERR
jgi:RNA polymerase sigma factor (sigma-70 family)